MNKKHLQCLSDSLTLRPLNWIWKLFFLLSFSTFRSRLQPSTYYHFISGWSATVLMNLLISVLVLHVCPADNNSTKILQTFWQRPFRFGSVSDHINTQLSFWIHPIHSSFTMTFNSVHTTSIACLSVLRGGSLLCCSSWGFFHFPYLKRGLEEFFLIRIEGLGADCKAPWAKLICDTGLYK